MNRREKKKMAAAQAQRLSKLKEDRKHILTNDSGFGQQEAYKTLRANVNFALADAEGCRVVMFTSALQGEGKSLSALNLSIAFAQTDKKVLLIDCDLRRPKMARLLNLNAPAGLSNVLLDFSLLEVALITSEEHGIDLVLAGDIPPNPAELLSSGRMQKLMEILRKRYDYIILDAPPIVPVVDAVAMSSLCDGILFLAHAGMSDRAAVAYSIEQLEYAKANVIGFVFNGMKSGITTGRGKYRYRQYIRYGRYGRHGGYAYGRDYGKNGAIPEVPGGVEKG